MLIGATASGGLVLLALLACPLGMVLMMVFMARGMMGGRKGRDDRPGDDHSSSLAELKAEQARLAEKIEALEVRPKPPQIDAPAKDREPDPVR